MKKVVRQRRNVYMADTDYQYLHKRGKGNASEGLRKAIESDKRLQQSWAEGRVTVDVKAKDGE